MTRAWIGISLLAGSWLLGLPYYQPASPYAWAALVIIGAVLLCGSVRLAPSRLEAGLAILLLAPAMWLAPWPFRAALLLLAAGLIFMLIPGRWAKWLGSGLVAAGVVLLAQSLSMIAYEHLTARSHELPWPWPWLLGQVANLLGVDVAVDGQRVAMHTMRQVHSLGATWELLFDPVTACFLAGGLVLLVLRTWSSSGAGRWKRIVGPALTLAGCVALWLPLRAALLMAAYLHQNLHTDYDAPLRLMGQFWDPWVLAGLLVGPVALASVLIRLPQASAAAAAQTPRKWRRPLAVALAASAVGVLALAMLWDPVGQRKAGHVVIDEFHSKWEPTSRPYDTAWYGHESGYNYACIYDYCSRFYEMSRLTAAIDETTLANCDVFILKVPTSPLAEAEIQALCQFVARGGGLLLIGEHTDVFGTGTYLNDVVRNFGFAFRYDCLFGIKSVFEELYVRPALPHPMIQHLPPLDYEISCSIDPGFSRGRAVMIGTGLKNLTADYHVSNFYPQAVDAAEMRYGAFVQLWATRHGAGRVAAFTDSTQFSNFSTFEPGKPELMLGMLEWLNRRDSLGDVQLWLAGAGLVLLIGAFLIGRPVASNALLMLAGGVLGWSAAAGAMTVSNRLAMPPPTPVRPMVQVAIDRTVCDAILSKGGFIGGRSDGFGIFERWILRLGWFTHRRAGQEAFAYDMLVMMHPNKQPSPEYVRGLEAYVAAGGKVLVLDSAENGASTANSLLRPFGLEVGPTPGLAGRLTSPAGWPSVPVKSAREVRGGQPLITLDGKAVAATARHGRGTVSVVGFAGAFTDQNMGVTGDVAPGDELMKLYKLEFALLRWAQGGVSASGPARQPSGHGTPAVPGGDAVASPASVPASGPTSAPAASSGGGI